MHKKECILMEMECSGLSLKKGNGYLIWEWFSYNRKYIFDAQNVYI